MNEPTIEAVEQEIAAIESQVASRQAEQPIDPEQLIEKQYLYDVVGEIIQEELSDQQYTPPPLAPAGHQQLAYHSEEYKEHIQNLVTIAFNQSIYEAIRQARKTNNPAFIAAFRAAIVDELYPLLVQRAKLRAQL